MNPLSLNNRCRRSLLAMAVIVVLTSGWSTMGQPAGAENAKPANSAQPQVPSLLAVFENKVDSKSAKVGDTIVAKTTKDLKLNDLDIPKGSKLEGAVTSVDAAQGKNGDSILGVRFDRIEMKKEKVMRIQGLIVAIGPAPTNETGLGYNSVLSRGGVGSDPQLDPSIAADKYDKDKPQLLHGSTLEGVALSTNFDSKGATLLRGVHRNVTLNSDVMVRVALFQPKQ